MRRIVVLCGAIAAVLLLCFLDGNRQRAGVLPASSGAAGGGEETEPQEAAYPAARKEEATDGASSGQKIGEPEREIRVLLKTAGFASEYHEAVTVSSKSGFTVSGGADTGKAAAGEERTFTAASEEFEASDVLSLQSSDGQFVIRNLNRERESEVYEGALEIRRVKNGLLLINILPLEEYLCGVVCSEMPSSYPEEALKAQAVCARTYACLRMQQQSATDYFADVDDSVSYQVYNNQEHSPATDAAVRDTAGVVLADETGSLIEAMYYSTSCGIDTDIDLSSEAVFAAVLSEDNIRAYEAEEPWYRWTADILLEDLPDVAELQVQRRLENGAADLLLVTAEDGAQQAVEGEYRIRQFLGQAGAAVILQSGETKEGMALLPSAFFVMQPLYDSGLLSGYHILGGGYGHGVGMSQNGAKHMAMEGMDYREILQKYYKDASFWNPAENRGK